MRFNGSLAAMAAALLVPTKIDPMFLPTRENIDRARKAIREGSPWLHPTKGWRGDGTSPRGTNKRRSRRAA